MRRLKDNKVLLISIAILLLLLCVYYRKPLGEFALKCRDTAVVKIEEYKEHSIERKAIRAEKKAEREAEREAKREAKRLAKEAKKQEEKTDSSATEIASDEPIVLDTEELIKTRTFSSEELALISEQNGVVLTAKDGSRYVTRSFTDEDGNPTMSYMLILESVDGITFRASDEYVYSAACVKLFDSPSYINAVKTAGQWEEFKRVGIAENGCYQLVTDEGRILYSDGEHFRRYREDMPLTETINMPAERIELEIDHLNQNPTLPNGCEITSLAMVLNKLGFEVTKENLSDNYLPKAKIGKANFYKEFVGNPRNADSYGCYAGAIVNAANSYLASQGSSYKAVDYTGSDFKTLLELVKEGKPVIVWTTCYIDEDPGYTTKWVVDGEYLVWKANLHCVVLKGYDTEKHTVIVDDPMRSTEEYDMTLFIKRFKQFYSQAVVVE